MHTHDDDFPTDVFGHRVIKNVREPEVRLRHPWGETDFVQGGRGITFEMEDGTERQSPTFVEAVTDSLNPDRNGGGTLIRGEGATIEEAEDAAWAVYQRQVGCPSPTGDHEYETRGYTNGVGYCMHCGRFQSHAFTLSEIGSVCVLCGGDYYMDAGDKMVCQQHTPPTYLDLNHHVRGGHELPQWVAGFIPEGVAFTDMEFDEKYAAVGHAQEFFVDLLSAEPDEWSRIRLQAQLWDGIETFEQRMARYDAERAAKVAEQSDAEFSEALADVLTSLSGPSAGEVAED